MKSGIAQARRALGVTGVVMAMMGAAAFGDAAQPAGKAYVTQTATIAAIQDYDTSFGENWESVRTFRLLSPLEKPLKVYIETHPNQAPYLPQYRTYVLEGLQSWSEALDGRLQFVPVRRRKDADITVSWVSSFPDRYVAGVTTYSVGHADVEIRTVGVPQKDIQCNILHELGHALGISGHSDHAGDIMVASRRWRRDQAAYHPTLSERDIRAVRRLYSAFWLKGEDLYTAAAQNPMTNDPKTASAQLEIPINGADLKPPARTTVVPPVPVGIRNKYTRSGI